jgi:hypothetical protein
MRPRTTSSAIGIASMAPSSHADCARWASGTSPLIRRECVDHFVVLGEAHLRRILRAYARYYNDIRTHWSLDKDAPALARFSGPEALIHTRSLVDFITITYGFRFLVHTEAYWLDPPGVPGPHDRIR